MAPFGPNPAGNGTLACQYQYTVPFNSPGTSSSLPKVTRSYTSFSQASDENALSRIYFGYHFRKSVTDGKAIGGYAASSVLNPVS